MPASTSTRARLSRKKDHRRVRVSGTGLPLPNTCAAATVLIWDYASVSGFAQLPDTARRFGGSKFNENRDVLNRICCRSARRRDRGNLLAPGSAAPLSRAAATGLCLSSAGRRGGSSRGR
ncbi:exported hypothetical protein [Burkholderiales bacterium]|nr:exported hypothetical protein [Burkholderiales bacterium]